ncbi:MAG TPA: hypothetical protein VFS95_03405 [Telluria sp.]|nr:hypothetical protein [Telluria sp.]
MRLYVLFIVATFAVAVGAACGKGQTATAQGEAAAQLASPEYKKRVQAELERMRKEEQVVEQAEWFGKTGLSDAIERELPRYLRREMGQSIFDEGALKAGSLQYVGVYPEGLNSIHFWRIADGAKEPHFAYVTVSAGGKTVIGWGGRQPPGFR